MSRADKIYIEQVNDIIANGMPTNDHGTRPVWADGTPAHSVKKFFSVTEYDLQKEFPILTLRNVSPKAALDEILWIYQKKSNKISELNSKVWDEWADAKGTIGTCYGWKIAQKFQDIDGEWLDQTDYILKHLKQNPMNRRMMTNMFAHTDLKTAGLPPCAYGINFNVTVNEDGKYVLNGILNQRSGDLLAAAGAGGWNEVQYSLLLMMFAQASGMLPGRFAHVVCDMHIYDRHIPVVQDIITKEQYAAPKISFNPEITNFYDFTVNDLIIEDYKFNKRTDRVELAI